MVCKSLVNVWKSDCFHICLEHWLQLFAMEMTENGVWSVWDHSCVKVATNCTLSARVTTVEFGEMLLKAVCT